METSTASTSVDSTPLQTPTQDWERDFEPINAGGVEVEGHDPDVDVLGKIEGLRRTTAGFGIHMEMQNGFPATVVDDGSRGFGKGGGKGIGEEGLEPSPQPSGIEMGTSPPFSLLAGMESCRQFPTSPPAAMYWPRGLGAGAKEGEEKGGNDDNNKMPSASSTGSTTPTMTVTPSSPAPSTPVPVPGFHQHARTSSNSSISNPMMPPQRRKGHPHHHHHHHIPPTFSISGSSSSASTSGSGSGSDTNLIEGLRSKSRYKSSSSSSSSSSHTPTKITTPKIATPQPWPAPPHFRVASPPPNPPRRAFVPSDMKTNNQVDDDIQSKGRPSPPKREMSPDPGVNSPVQDDALYQAFVRQWCFVQEPGPSVGAGSVGKEKEDVVVR